LGKNASRNTSTPVFNICNWKSYAPLLFLKAFLHTLWDLTKATFRGYAGMKLGQRLLDPPSHEASGRHMQHKAHISSRPFSFWALQIRGKFKAGKEGGNNNASRFFANKLSWG
jgi:hypothetical protein